MTPELLGPSTLWSFASNISFWSLVSNIAVGVLGVLAAAAAGSALYFSSRLTAEKDAELERFEQQAAADIAEANSSAAKAEEGTAQALADVAAAHERSASLEVEAASQRERAAVAERILLELQGQLADRTVDEAQANLIVAQLSPHRGQDITLWSANNAEAIQFSSRLGEVLERAGLVVSTSNTTVLGAPGSGLLARAGTNRMALANALAQALVQSGLVDERLVIVRSRDPDELRLEVWPKDP